MTILETAATPEQFTKESFLFKVLLLGKSGSGKSTGAALSLPEPVLFIDYDGRSESVAGFPGVKVIKILEENPKSPTAWSKAEKLKDELWAAVRKKELPYHSIIEAGLTSMNRTCMYWALLLDPKRGLGGSAAKQHYAPQMKNLQDHIISMMNLPTHYVLEAHYEYIENEAEGTTDVFPKLYGKIRTELPGLFNECYHSYHQEDSKEKKTRYFWHTKGFGKFDFMKSSLNQLGKYWTDPIEINFEEKPTGFMKLLDLRFGKETSHEENTKTIEDKKA